MKMEKTRDKIYDIVGVGNALLDRMALVDDDFLSHHNISKSHMALTDKTAMAALQKGMVPQEEASGGAVANCLVGAAQLGSKAVFIGRLGEDAYGKTFIDDLEANNVIYAGRRVKDHTGICLVLITPDAQRTMQTFLGASEALARDDVDEKFIAQAKILYLEAYLWYSPSAQQAAEQAASSARKNGALVALNLSDRLCVESQLQKLKDFVHNEIDILIANEEEICAFHQTADFAEAEAACLEMKTPFMALTRSEKGSVIIDHGTAHHIAAVAPRQLVDTTGAGDLYAAGFLHALANGRGTLAGGQLGAKMAAAIIQIYGARLKKAISL